MKKIILMFLILFLVVGCGKSNYNGLNYKELKEKLDNKETFILLLNDNSSDSKILSDSLNTVLEKNNLIAYELNPTKLTNDEKNNLRTYFAYQNTGIIFIKDGIESSKLTQITDPLTKINDIENHLKNLGYIKTSN